MTIEETAEATSPQVLSGNASPEPAMIGAHHDSTEDENAPMVVVEKEEKPCGASAALTELKSPKIAVASEKPQPTPAQKAAIIPANKKLHLEQRLRRHFVWGTMNFAIFCGRLLSKMGVRNAQQNALRKTARLGGGVKRSVLAGVHHAKSTIAGVKVRVYKPDVGANEQATPRPVFIYIHGGGWVICSARSYHPFALELCRDTGATVVTVDYRLAPEHPYPAGLEDCLAVTKAILNGGEEMGSELQGGIVDHTRVVIGGDSAGGNLSAAVALELIRAGDTRLHATVLICPALQAITQELESYKKHAGKYSTIGLGWFVSQYAGVVAPSRKLTRAIDAGRHLPEETSQRLIAQFLTTKSGSAEEQQQQAGNGNQANAAASSAPDSGCQTASSSLPSPSVANDTPRGENAEPAAAPAPAVEVEAAAQPAAVASEGLVVPVVAAAAAEEKQPQLTNSASAEGHVETDQLIDNSQKESQQEVPDCVTELVTCVRAWPLLAADSELAQMPITMIQVCSDDPLLDEGRIFSERLRSAGARDVRYFFLPRAQHAEPVLGKFLHSKAAKRGYAEIVSFVRGVTGMDEKHDIDNQNTSNASKEAILATPDAIVRVVSPAPGHMIEVIVEEGAIAANAANEEAAGIKTEPVAEVMAS